MDDQTKTPKNPPYTNSNYLSLELHNLYFDMCALVEQTNITFLKSYYVIK